MMASWAQLEQTTTALQSIAVDTAAAERLLPPGIDTDSFGWTALHYAAAAGIKSLVQQSLDAGIAVDCKGYLGCTPLMCAVKYGYMTIIEQLIDQGADVNARALQWRSRTSLHEAVVQGHTAATELLLARGAFINAVNSDCNTPLHDAIFHCHPAIIALLLAKGAAVDVVDDIKVTPLHFAAYRGLVTAVELLLAKGAAVDAVDLFDSTPLHEAAAYPHRASTGHAAVAGLLLEHGAAINAVDERGRTPLHRAASNGRTEVVKLLLSKGAVVHVQDHDGNTPLSCAVERIEEVTGVDDPNPKLDVLKVILQAGRPWPPAALIAAAKVALCRIPQPNRTAFAVLARAIFMTDREAFTQLLEQLRLQEEDSEATADDVVQALVEGWCSDVASLDQQRAELLQQRRDVEAQRSAVQHMIVNAACFMKHVVEKTGAARLVANGGHEVQQ